MITPFLDAYDIAQLWLSGDSSLQLRLRHGGVKSLRVENPLTFPAIASQFRGLKSFELRLSDRVSKSQLLIPGFDMTQLASGLEELFLDFPTVLGYFGHQQPLASLFPNLTSLELPNNPMESSTFSIGSFISELPKTLRRLFLPGYISVDLETLLSMPCRLESLRVCIADMEEGQEAQFRNASIFEELTTLAVSEAYVCWPRILPPSVTDFTWKVSSSKDLEDQVTAEDLKLLPQHLCSLKVTWWPHRDLSLLNALPRGLKCLQLIPPAGYGTEHTYDFVKYLPPNLTELFTPEILTVQDPPYAPLPKNLKEWPSWSVESPLARDSSLPETIRFLHIENPKDDDICKLGPNNVAKSLPASITDLVLPFAHHLTVFGLSKLPTALTRLSIDNCTSFDPVCLPLLPTSLTELVLKPRNLALPENGMWQYAWPTRLHELVFEVGYIGGGRNTELGAGFWSSFSPLPLDELVLQLPLLSDMPPSLAFLPKSLKGVRLGSGTNPHLVADAFFSDLPPALEDLTLHNFDKRQLTPSFCLQLPKTLRSLSILWGQTRLLGPEPKCPLLTFGTSPERLPQLWQFLDCLPRHLHLHLGKPPDFATWLDKRLSDDIYEECPGVAAKLRLTRRNTPRRQKN